jgi:hypothetical protein
MPYQHRGKPQTVNDPADNSTNDVADYGPDDSAMKDTTFGDSDAAKTLSKILVGPEQKKVRANVTSYWSSYCHMVNEIFNMPDKHVALSLLTLLKENAVKRARERFKGEVQTYVCNITVAKFRDRKELLGYIINGTV